MILNELAREIENEVFDFINYKHRAESAIDQSDELIIFERKVNLKVNYL